MKNIYLIIVLSVVSVLFNSGCKQSAGGKSILSGVKEIIAPTQRHDANIIGLQDFSKPAAGNPDNSALFCRLIGDHIVKRLTISSSLVLLPVDKASESDAPELIKADLLSMCFVPQGTAPIDAKKVELRNSGKYKDSINAKWVSSFDSIKKQREKHSIGTDIVAGLRVVKQYCRKDEPNIVIIFSDMLMYVPGINMENPKYSSVDEEKWLNKLEKVDLPGTEVLIITGPQNNVELYEKTRAFWTKYFAQCHIKVAEYSSENYESLDRLLIKYLK